MIIAHSTHISNCQKLRKMVQSLQLKSHITRSQTFIIIIKMILAGPHRSEVTEHCLQEAIPKIQKYGVTHGPMQ